MDTGYLIIQLYMQPVQTYGGGMIAMKEGGFPFLALYM